MPGVFACLAYVGAETRSMLERNLCHDCGAKPGELHEYGCDVEHCPTCGHQLISCDHRFKESSRMPWTGEWPGKAECRAFGWYSKWTTHGWERCSKSDPDAHEDLDRLYEGEAQRDRNEQRFVLSQGVL